MASVINWLYSPISLLYIVVYINILMSEMIVVKGKDYVIKDEKEIRHNLKIDTNSCCDVINTNVIEHSRGEFSSEKAHDEIPHKQFISTVHSIDANAKGRKYFTHELSHASSSMNKNINVFVSSHVDNGTDHLKVQAHRNVHRYCSDLCNDTLTNKMHQFPLQINISNKHENNITSSRYAIDINAMPPTSSSIRAKRKILVTAQNNYNPLEEEKRPERPRLFSWSSDAANTPISQQNPHSQNILGDSNNPPGQHHPAQQMNGLTEAPPRSGRTTTRREALVRASLIDEDRNHNLKMLPTNKIVGLTMQPGTQHR